MPAYNAELTVESAVRSVLSQSYTDIELIVVDDGSKDSTLLLLNQLHEQDSRLKILHTENQGVSRARNFGIEMSSGELLGFIDADDTMIPEMVERLVGNFSDKVDLVCSGYTVVSYDGKELNRQQPKNAVWKRNELYKGIGNLQETKSFNSLWNKLFRMDIVKKNSVKMKAGIKMGEDMLFVSDYLKACKLGMACISDCLYKYTLSPEGAQASWKIAESYEYRSGQLYELLPLYEKEKYPMETFYAEHLRCVYVSMIEGNVKEALKSLYVDPHAVKMMRDYKPQNIKFGLFLFCLKSRCMVLIQAMVWIFRKYMRAAGKTFIWHE